MAEETEKGKKEHKLHLHEIRSVQAEDGSIVHHHTYKRKKGDAQTMPERQNVATSQTPEEAGQHVEEQMGMNSMGGGEPDGDEGQPGDQAAQPAE